MKMLGNEDMFKAFDFRYNGPFRFWGDTRHAPIVDIDISSISDQITKLSLMNVVLGQKPSQPLRFVQLEALDLQSIAFSGILGDFLTLPNLKSLRLTRVMMWLSGGNMGPVFSDQIFLQGSPVLETMVLNRMYIGDGFIKGLKSCRLLKSLNLKKCQIECFVNPLLEYSQSSQFLPSLQTLKIIDSWSLNLGMSFEGFRSRFAAKRPSVAVSDVRSWEYYSDYELRESGDEEMDGSSNNEDDYFF
jgi:hypothetical protein